VAIHGVFEPAFLATDFAVNNEIEDIVWRTPSAQYWDDLIDTGEIDVCWGGGPTLFDQLMRDNYLSSLNTTRMQTVQARVNDSIAGADMKRLNDADQLMWIAAAISSFGFTVNNDFLTTHSLPKPSSWTDLAGPIYGSLLPGLPTIAMGNSPGTTSNTRIYEIMVQGLGWDVGWANMARMAGSANIYSGSVPTQQAVEIAEVGISMSIDFYGYISQRNNPDCEYIVPEGQTIINGDPIAIASTSTQKALAEGFLDFVLSPEGQVLWLDANILRMPVMREAFDEPEAAGADDLYSAFNQTTATTGIDFNDTMSVNMNAAFTTYWEAVFTNSHQELVNCWTAILTAYDEGRINLSELEAYGALMGAPVSILDPITSVLEEFTAEYAMRMNNDMIYDSTYASDASTSWTTAAKAQYAIVQAQAEAET
jgi:ABC-type Fe3+ transport system substrate-binding protein